MRSLTDALLEEAVGKAYSMSMEGERGTFREYERSEGARVQGQKKLLEAVTEANRRGILKGIQERNPDWRLPYMAPLQDLYNILECQLGWVGQRGFEHDKRLVTCLEELIAFRRMFRRQELTGEDEAREWSAACDRDVDLGRFEDIFLAGLRRGFELRGEEQPTKPTTKPKGEA